MAAVPQIPNAIGRLRYIKAMNSEIGIVALAGGGQTGATSLTAQVNRIDTVASGNDSVSLPKIGPVSEASANLCPVGHIVFVKNASASNAAFVIGKTPDTIDGVATGTGVSLTAAKGALYVAVSYNPTTNVGDWMSILSA